MTTKNFVKRFQISDFRFQILSISLLLLCLPNVKSQTPGTWTLQSTTNTYKVIAATDGSAPVTQGYINLGGVKNGVSSDLLLYPAGGSKLQIAGPLNVQVDASIAGKLSVTGLSTFASNTIFMGKVGIKTTNPTSELTVNGKILAEEFEIVVDVPASDFVFEPNYKLMSLHDLEAYVTTNKHLPEIKSTADFKANGYKVGQMDDLLLRKVEELTLYTIELSKQLDAVKAKLAKVKEGK